MSDTKKAKGLLALTLTGTLFPRHIVEGLISESEQQQATIDALNKSYAKLHKYAFHHNSLSGITQFDKPVQNNE